MPSITDTRSRIREQMKNFAFPIWLIEYSIDNAQFDEVRQAINKQYQYNMMLGIGKTYEVDGHRGFLFNSKTGRPMQLSAYNCVLKNIVNKYNAIETARAKYERRKPDLMPRITSHILRHTGCTRMAEQGISIKILQYIMGHENVAVTLQVYTHISDPNMVATELEKADPLKVAR
jgi:integrase